MEDTARRRSTNTSLPTPAAAGRHDRSSSSDCRRSRSCSRYPICVEGAPPDHGDIRSRAFDVLPMPFELSDGTIFVLLERFVPGPFQQGLLRLDDQGREHSTLGGEVCLLDAKPIQGAVSTADADGDLNALWTVIRRALFKQHNIKVERRSYRRSADKIVFSSFVSSSCRNDAGDGHALDV